MPAKFPAWEIHKPSGKKFDDLRELFFTNILHGFVFFQEFLGLKSPDIQSVSFSHNAKEQIRSSFPSFSGPAGPPGYIGAHGEPGMPGNPGRPGDIGAPGMSGLPGVPGGTGFRGSHGGIGSPGRRGNPGAPGQPGSPGLPGNSGYQGQPGSPGLRGYSGYPGVPGSPGLRGNSGYQGQPGSPGLPGNSGNQGPPGSTGLPGNSGNQGLPGSPGRLGLSEYYEIPQERQINTADNTRSLYGREDKRLSNSESHYYNNRQMSGQKRGDQGIPLEFESPKTASEIMKNLKLSDHPECKDEVDHAALMNTLKDKGKVSFMIVVDLQESIYCIVHS